MHVLFMHVFLGHNPTQHVDIRIQTFLFTFDDV